MEIKACLSCHYQNKTKLITLNINGVCRKYSALVRLYWTGDSLGSRGKFCSESFPGAGSIEHFVDQQSSALPLHHGYPKKQVIMICTSFKK